MGKFADLVRENSAPKQESLPDAWVEQFPLLTEALFPEPGKASGTYLTPKYSVTLFTEGKRLKAVVGARDGKRKFWTTLDGPEAVLEQVELALKSDHGEWRDAAEQN